MSRDCLEETFFEIVLKASLANNRRVVQVKSWEEIKGVDSTVPSTGNGTGHIHAAAEAKEERDRNERNRLA